MPFNLTATFWYCSFCFTDREAGLEGCYPASKCWLEIRFKTYPSYSRDLMLNYYALICLLIHLFHKYIFKHLLCFVFLTPALSHTLNTGQLEKSHSLTELSIIGGDSHKKLTAEWWYICARTECRRVPKAQKKAIPTDSWKGEMERAQRHKINIQNTFLLPPNQEISSN